MRRRVPWWVLALLFVVVPMVEIYLIVQLGQTVGPWWTIALLIGAGILGSWLVKREGGRAWRALTEALRVGRVPSRELADGALILIGGTLLLTPGFLSDVVGLVCILPVTRPLPRRLLSAAISRRLLVGGPLGGPSGGAPRRPTRNNPDDDTPPDPGVVRGDVVD